MRQEAIYTKTCDDIFNCGHDRDLFQVNGYSIKECTLCKHRYTIPNLNIKNHINENYNDDYFFGGKAGYPNYLEEKDILVEHGEHYAKIINKIKSPGRILDVGCAAGFLLQGFINKGWQGSGIEPNNQMVSFGRDKLKIEIKRSTLEDFDTTDKFDLVSLIQVIGHFHNIDKSIRKYFKNSF